MRIFWNKCQGNVWCPLYEVNLNHEHFDNMYGVYLIWYSNPSDAKVVYVGQGFIRDRLADHRYDARIQRYRHLSLYATWAAVEANSQNGVEKYLANSWNPLVGVLHPDVLPIPVNSPWE